MKDAGGGTSGPGETSSSRSMTLRSLLKELAKKYDQYDDYMQQDAHELLRHLLDSMEMEEKDVIKRLQPAGLEITKRRKSKRHGEVRQSSPIPTPLPSPAGSSSSSPEKSTSPKSLPLALPLHSARPPSVSSISTAGDELKDIPDSERMVPFVDVLFGGSLASVVVCENCKSVNLSIIVV